MRFSVVFYLTLAGGLLVGATIYLRKRKNKQLEKKPPSNPTTQKDLVDLLVHNKIVRSKRIQDVLYKVDRINYVPQSPNTSQLTIKEIYADNALGLPKNATISAPHMYGIMLDLLEPHIHQNSVVLDIGCGSGYVTACLAYLVQPLGKVVAIDHEAELVSLAETQIRNGNPALLSHIQFLVGDALSSSVSTTIGINEFSINNINEGVDAIMIGAAAESVESLSPLLRLLRPGGGVCVPIGPPNGFHRLMVISRENNKETFQLDFKDYGMVRFVPLQSRNQQAVADVFSAPVKRMLNSDNQSLIVKPTIHPAQDLSPDEYRTIREDLRKLSRQRGV